MDPIAEFMQWFALLLVWCALLLGGGFVIEGMVRWRDRRWIRRLRGMENGRRVQRETAP